MSNKEIVCDLKNIDLEKLSIHIPKKKSCYSMSILYDKKPLVVNFPYIGLSYDERFDTRKFTFVLNCEADTIDFVKAVRKLINKEVKQILKADNVKHEYFSPFNEKGQIRIKENQYTPFVGYNQMKKRTERVDVRVHALAKLTKYENKIFISFWGKKIEPINPDSDSDSSESDSGEE